MTALPTSLGARTSCSLPDRRRDGSSIDSPEGGESARGETASEYDDLLEGDEQRWRNRGSGVVEQNQQGGE